MNDDQFHLEPDPTPEPGEDFEADVAELLAAIKAVIRDGVNETTSKRLYDAMANVEAWYEDDDPRSMGWTDDKGRP